MLFVRPTVGSTRTQGLPPAKSQSIAHGGTASFVRNALTLLDEREDGPTRTVAEPTLRNRVQSYSRDGFRHSRIYATLRASYSPATHHELPALFFYVCFVFVLRRTEARNPHRRPRRTCFVSHTDRRSKSKQGPRIDSRNQVGILLVLEEEESGSFYFVFFSIFIVDQADSFWLEWRQADREGDDDENAGYRVKKRTQ